MRISDWRSDVCSSDLNTKELREALRADTPALSLPFVNGQVFGDLPVVPAYDAAAAGKMLDDAGWVINDGVRKKGEQALRLNVVVIEIGRASCREGVCQYV